MTTETKIARRKLSLLQLAAELANVSKACKIMDYSRRQEITHWGNKPCAFYCG